MTVDQAPKMQRRKTAVLIGGLLGGIIVVGGVLTNTKAIVEFIEHMIAAVLPTPPHMVVKVCMGEGGGNSCTAGAGASYDCNAYSDMGGGAQKTYDFLADNFCGYTNNFGTHKVYPHHISVYQNNGGGKCGWVGLQVTCN